MSQLKMIDTCPAYDVLEMPTRFDAATGQHQPTLRDGDLIGLKGRGYWNEYTIGSAIGSALKYGDDPMVAVERAKANHHDLHFIYANSTCISSSPQARRTLFAVTIGQVVRFHGLMFKIDRAPNNNLKLVRVTA